MLAAALLGRLRDPGLLRALADAAAPEKALSLSAEGRAAEGAAWLCCVVRRAKASRNIASRLPRLVWLLLLFTDRFFLKLRENTGPTICLGVGFERATAAASALPIAEPVTAVSSFSSAFLLKKMSAGGV